MSLKDYLQKRKPEGDLQSLVIEIATDMVTKKFEELKSQLISDTSQLIESHLQEIKDTVKKGDKGEDGKNGVDGSNGRDGVNGKSGTNGRDGVDGKDGLKGKDGSDGSPDKPDDIVKKLNTLEGVLDIKILKGFKNIIQNLRPVKSGGGMGNWVTEIPTGAINDVNTSYTITSNVAGGGKAIILLYNGQVQEYTNHFTVSGKTITMTFAPATSSALFAMYVRK